MVSRGKLDGEARVYGPDGKLKGVMRLHMETDLPEKEARDLLKTVMEDESNGNHSLDDTAGCTR